MSMSMSSSSSSSSSPPPPPAAAASWSYHYIIEFVPQLNHRNELWKVLSAFGIVVAIMLYQRIKPFHVPPSVPGPKRFPLVGYLWHPLWYWSQWPTETTRLAKLYQRTWGGPMPNLGGLPGAYFYIHEERNLRHILRDNFDNYGKGDMWIKVLGELLGEGIFAVDGDRWRVHRKLMSHMFSRNLLRHSASVTTEKLAEVLNVFETRARRAWEAASPDARAGGGKIGFDLDLQDLFFRLTIDVTSKVTFGIDLHSVENETQHEFARAFDELSCLCQKRFLDPLFELKRLFRLTWRERRIRALKTVVDDFAMSVIATKRRSAEDVSSRSPLGTDLLSRFIEHARKVQEDVSDVELRDVVMNVMLAGRDTTACALAWTFYELTRHPAVAARIVDEVKAVCGVGENARYTYDAMSELRYTHCVALEVLRLHPSVTNDPRYAVTDDVLPDGTRVPGGCGFDLCFYSMGRKEEIWGQDALEFKPERFLDEMEPSPFKYPVFNAGPRLCIGKPLALMNMKLVMSMLLTSNFQITDEIGHTGEYHWTLVEAMKDGFKIRVTRRTPF